LALLISGKGSTGAQMVELFNEQNIKQIFSKRLFSFLSIFYGPKYKGVGKRNLLHQFFAEQRLSSLSKQTLITAYDIMNNCAVIFKSLDKDSNDMAGDPTIAAVADASSAAPTYFPPVLLAGNTPRCLVDGGISANDPTMCILVEALRMGYALGDIHILSLGTGVANTPAVVNLCKKSQSWGGIGWLQNGIVDDLFSGNVSITEYQVKELLNEGYFRVNGSLQNVSTKLDDISPINLQALQATGRAWYAEHKDEAGYDKKPMDCHYKLF
jgi:patatin-like phospholipase/acyl hydrolase